MFIPNFLAWRLALLATLQDFNLVFRNVFYKFFSLFAQYFEKYEPNRTPHGSFGLVLRPPTSSKVFL